MAEQRLIDANALYEDWLENGENEYVHDTNSFLSSLDDAHTIDPETLPIVRQLREELARVTVERDAAVKDINLVRACATCALQHTDKCLLEECMDPCCSFGSGDVPYKWRGPQKEAHP